MAKSTTKKITPKAKGLTKKKPLRKAHPAKKTVAPKRAAKKRSKRV